ncbi:hypothetical protein AU198_09375 [Mycobacterium sp. GA-1199]|nr:hypothetical protein AU198_09375 [Mycobacterium sp. GA-1199]
MLHPVVLDAHFPLVPAHIDSAIANADLRGRAGQPVTDEEQAKLGLFRRFRAAIDETQRRAQFTDAPCAGIAVRDTCTSAMVHPVALSRASIRMIPRSPCARRPRS